MSIRKDVTVKITNNNATLDMPLQIYELDHGIELRFKLMDYKYKYTKDPQNILNSSDEDILEAYTTIINPRGYELQQINGEVKDDIVIFMIDSSYTDEIDEIGTYSLQIHIKCACSEFSIPPIQFEVLQRLKGIKVITDGEDSIDDSALIDNYSNFISDETGKLLIEWKKGDIISSVKLNAMVEVINNAVDEEAQRQLNEVKREQQELERQNKVREALNSVDVRVDEAMIEYETRFNALTVSQQQDMEVIDARDGEVSLKARLDRDLRKPLQVYEDVEGSYISYDSVEGYAQNVEILGNTIQNQNDLADIRSVGDKLGNQELYKIPVLSTGRNLVDAYTNLGEAMFVTSNGGPRENPAWRYTIDYFRVEPNREIAIGETSTDYRQYQVSFYDVNYKWIETREITPHIISTITPQNAYYMRFSYSVAVSGSSVDRVGLQVEYGSITTPYEEYREDKLTILSPTPLEKIGDVADRIICKDGVWGVEKNIENVTFDGSEAWVINKDGTNTSIFSLVKDGVINRDNDGIYCISNKFVSLGADYQWANESESISVNKNGRILIQIFKEKLTTIDSKGFKEWLQQNNICVKYSLAQPQFIPLPHDQQVKLRTFANKTNIHFECEIEPTLKASVPKSIGATVNSHSEQIDNLGKELDRVKKLEESVASEVITESDFTTVTETSNGYFEDVKLEGKTFVNMLKTTSYILGVGELSEEDYTLSYSRNCIKYVKINTNKTPKWLYISCDKLPFDMLKPNTKYTIKLDKCVGVISAEFKRNDGTKAISDIGVFDANGCAVVTTTSELVDADQVLYLNVKSYMVSEVEVSNAILLEGDHTQNPPEFFEGLKSVGQDVDEISVESLKGDGNLCEGNELNISIKNGVSGTFSKYIAFRPTSDSVAYFVDCEGGQLNTANVAFSFLDKSKNILGKPNYTPTNLHNYNFRFSDRGIKYSDVYYLKVFWNDKVGKDVMISNLTFISGNVAPTKHITHKQDKKRILYYDQETQTWEKPVLRQWDSIEKHSDGKYYYHKRSEEVVLDGSEDWIDRSTSYVSDTQTRFSIEHSVKPCSIGAISLICDKYPVIGAIPAVTSVYENGINHHTTGSTIYITVPKTTLQEFITTLEANPITVVYQLEKEKVYECTSIDLMTYENETNFMVNTGAITPKSTLKVMCNITNVVRELQQKVSNLENYIQHVMIDALNNALNE